MASSLLLKFRRDRSIEEETRFSSNFGRLLAPKKYPNDLNPFRAPHNPKRSFFKRFQNFDWSSDFWALNLILSIFQRTRTKINSHVFTMYNGMNHRKMIPIKWINQKTNWNGKSFEIPAICTHVNSKRKRNKRQNFNFTEMFWPQSRATISAQLIRFFVSSSAGKLKINQRKLAFVFFTFVCTVLKYGCVCVSLFSLSFSFLPFCFFLFEPTAKTHFCVCDDEMWEKSWWKL